MSYIPLSDYFKFIPDNCTREHMDYAYAKTYFLHDYDYSIRSSTYKPLKILELPAKNKTTVHSYNLILFIRFYIRRLFNYVKNKR